MTTTAFSKLAAPAEAISEAPETDLALGPSSVEEAARILDLASEQGARVLVWGGGTHQGVGGRVDPDIVLSTERLDRIVEWQAEDLTLVAEAGVPVARIEEELATQGQTAVLPENPGKATLGGVVAGGFSGWRRLRFGPTRDRMLEVLLVTGDGRLVRGGGRVVKNVTGYDLPRLATGSLGALGLVGQVCVKLWPLPHATVTVTLDDPDEAGQAFRPLAVVEERERTRVYLGGHPADVERQAAALGGRVREGLDWPEPLDDPLVLSLRVPVRLEAEARNRIPAGWRYQIERGTGHVRLGTLVSELAAARELRSWAEGEGGSLAIWQAPSDVYAAFDPWGSEPESMPIQRRLVARFDPARVLNPGRLPGGL